MVRCPRALVGPFIALSILTCTEAAGRTDPQGSYGLTAVDGHGLPALVGTIPVADRYLVGGSLQLDPGGSFTMSLVTMVDTRTGGPLVDSLPFVYLGAYFVFGRSIILSWTNDAGQRITFAGTAGGAWVTLAVADGRLLAAPATLAFLRPGPA